MRLVQLLDQPGCFKLRGGLLQVLTGGGEVATVAEELAPDDAGAGGFEASPAFLEAVQADGEVFLGLVPLTWAESCRGGKIGSYSACTLIDVMQAAEYGPRED